MNPDELLADTNRLLRLLVEIDEKRTAEEQQKQIEFDAQMAEHDAKHKEQMRLELEKRGVGGPDYDGTEEDWERRMQMAQDRAKLQAEELREKDQRYKDELIAELRKQSELLQKIAERSSE